MRLRCAEPKNQALNGVFYPLGKPPSKPLLNGATSQASALPSKPSTC